MDTLEKFHVSKQGKAYQVEYIIDESPDLSFYGKYTDKPDYNYLVIDRVKEGDYDRNEYKYFETTIEVSEIDSFLPYSGNNRKIATMKAWHSARLDYKAMEAYNKGDWNMIGIRVTDTTDSNQSAALWGIESNSDESYLKDTINDLIDEADNCSPNNPHYEFKYEF